MIIVVCLLIGLNAYQFYFSYLERKKLLDRIQAKDLVEYKTLEKPIMKEVKEIEKPIDFI